MDEAWKGLRHFQAPACSAHQGARWELVRQLRNKLREDAWRSTSCQVYKSTRVCAHAHTHTHTHTGPYKESAPSWACTPPTMFPTPTQIKPNSHQQLLPHSKASTQPQENM